MLAKIPTLLMPLACSNKSVQRVKPAEN